MESRQIPIKQDLDVFAARRVAREMAQALSFDLVEITAIETAVAELATNMLCHAGQGTMAFAPLQGERSGLEVRCEDQGPGIADVESALRDGCTTGGGLGIGLGGVKRLMDELAIDSRPGEGTRIAARKWTVESQRSAPSTSSGLALSTAGGSREAGEQGSENNKSRIGNQKSETWDLQLTPWRIEVAVASRPIGGATANGDGWLVREDGGRLLIALADGLGHGEEAARAAQKAVAYIEQHRRQSLTEIMQGCNEEVRDTRGIVLGLARLDPKAGTLTYAGIGNTGIRVTARATARPISLSGIVGYTVRKVREESFPCAPGDLIVMYTDGISERFDADDLLRHEQDLVKLVETILSEFGRENDDATVIAVRVSPSPGMGE